MSRIAVIGASRGIGFETVKTLLKLDHEVVAFSRSATKIQMDHPQLLKIAGDATQKSDINAALNGSDAVIQTLGVPLNSKLLTGPIELFSSSTRELIIAMNEAGIRRLISVTGFGAGDSKGAINCFQKIPFNIIFGHAYRDKSIQEDYIKKSGLDWTIVRPGVLINAPLKQTYKIYQHRKEWRNGFVSRRSVADYISRILFNVDSHGKDPVIVN